MDTALFLKQKSDSGEIRNHDEASALLDQSEIVSKLLTDFDVSVLNLLHRLIEIAEIPFADSIEKVQKWVSTLADLAVCEEGFSISGKRNDILSCYNSMITSVLIRMNYSNKDRISRGIDWILKYQNVERESENKWNGPGILKYGGCMKSTPCYIGVVKAMIALSDYVSQEYYTPNDLLENKLNKGLNYILDHQVYKRLSDGQPITRDIEKIAYPFSYKTNVVEILRLLKENNLHTDPRCRSAKDLLALRKRKTGFWQADKIYLPKHWVQFDKPREAGLWVSYEIGKIIDEGANA